jgi:hypothetical protein
VATGEYTHAGDGARLAMIVLQDDVKLYVVPPAVSNHCSGGMPYTCFHISVMPSRPR